MKGYVYPRKGKEVTRLWYVLEREANVIYVYKSHQDTKKPLRVLNVQHASAVNMKSLDKPDGSSAFIVQVDMSRGESEEFETDSEEEMKAWRTAISKVLQNGSDIKSDRAPLASNNQAGTGTTTASTTATATANSSINGEQATAAGGKPPSADTNVSGSLRKKEGKLIKTWKLRWFELRGAVLAIKADQHAAVPLETLRLTTECFVIATQNVKGLKQPHFAVVIDYGSVKHTFLAEDANRMNFWVSRVQAAIQALMFPGSSPPSLPSPSSPSSDDGPDAEDDKFYVKKSITWHARKGRASTLCHSGPQKFHIHIPVQPENFTGKLVHPVVKEDSPLHSGSIKITRSLVGETDTNSSPQGADVGKKRKPKVQFSETVHTYSV